MEDQYRINIIIKIFIRYGFFYIVIILKFYVAVTLNTDIHRISVSNIDTTLNTDIHRILVSNIDTTLKHNIDVTFVGNISIILNSNIDTTKKVANKSILIQYLSQY